MCGICGIFDRSGKTVEPAILQRMTSVLRHRGPDGAGDFFDRPVGLGHRRLSIIDIDGGAQPIENEDGRLQVVFNGEIYNFVELRAELEAFGHTFKTRSDTEVIVHAYEQWGRDCVKRFNGMFAFAIWDSTTREVFIARDHLGIKPLYYVDLGARVLFASEIKALLTDPDCPRAVDTDALAELFTFRYVPSPKTLFRGIVKLAPGHRMTISARGIEVDRFWTWIPRIRERYDEESLIEEYQTLLEDAVRLQLRSDVPLGLFLSSGVDSGVLLAIMSQYLSGPVRAFTIGFQGGEKSNEVDDARELASMFGANHESMMVGPDDYASYYERYMQDLEEPVGNETAAAFYFVSKITSKRVKVALAGQGADEPWAGYDRYVGAKLSAYYSRLPQAVTDPVASVVARIPGRFERLKRSAVALGEPDVLTRFAKMYSFFSADMKAELFNARLKGTIAGDAYHSKQSLRRLQQDVQHHDPLTQMLYIDTRASLPDDLLMVGDKMSMANSLESRVPFLDYRLIEFIESLPPEMKLNGLTGKYLHKKALEKWLPKEVVWRKKKGFANPVEHWFRNRMRPFVEEMLLSADSACGQYFDQHYIRRMLDLDRLGKEQFRRHIYLLLSFELWHRHFVKTQPVAVV
ncbi:MAG: asparagine synthase (glutamine-hydrolyzing) [Acidobacteria bacterium]|nr:asparagine synthase (glutamine-hydrolyzing) [Acidobacteriota bacterium]MCA1651989.1 asparagine synthase (glutamine-hydrolyzing) [Acidobacteriota bacterium]